MTKDDVSNIAQVSIATVSTWIKQGILITPGEPRKKLKAVKTNNRVFIAESDYNEFIKARKGAGNV